MTGSRVDISNGIVFMDIKAKETIQLNNLDRFIMIAVVKSGTLTIKDQIGEQVCVTQKSQNTLYTSSRQVWDMVADGEIFLLFLADFFLKRYLLGDANEPIDYLYQEIQKELSCKHIGTQPLDALSLYIIDKITHKSENMHAIRCEHHVIELMIHRFSLIDRVQEPVDEESRILAIKAKKELLKNFVNPPTIQSLAHLCASNESKLKKVFKQVYGMTIYSYIQRLRLNEANLLLKERASTIGEIAKAVGYKHQGHFSKLFFETYGVYPKDLLKSHPTPN